MWGASIIGYGSYSYRYPSGHSGEASLVGLAVRGRDVVLYLCPSTPAMAVLLGKLGKHRMGKGCLYLRRLADVDVAVLETLVAHSVAEVRRLYPAGA